MKRGTRAALVGPVLLALAALPFIQRGAASKAAGRSGGACCPLIQALDEMSLVTRTNTAVPPAATNPAPATNHP